MCIVVGVFLSVLLLVLLLISAVTLLDNKKRKKAVSVLRDDRLYYDACHSLFVQYRKIRHDFANYVQASQIALDGESREKIKMQKKMIRLLISQWMTEKEAFLKMSEEQTWNCGS